MVIFVLIGTILVLGLVAFIILILFLYRRKQIAYLQTVESLKLDHQKILLKTQLEIQEQTFQNISREIHDNIGLSLTLAKLNLNILDFEETPNLREKVLSSIELISQSITDLSDISKSLNSEAISEQGLLNALQLEIGRIKKLNCFAIDFEVKGNPVYFDSRKELILFRIAQEALNNIIKHSNANKIHLEVCFLERQIRLSIKDNGIGFSYTKGRKPSESKIKAGLTNMEIRSSSIDGNILIDSSIGKGTKIIVTAPLESTEI